MYGYILIIIIVVFLHVLIIYYINQNTKAVTKPQYTKDPAKIFQLGLHSFDNGTYEKATYYFTKSIELNYNKERSYFKRGHAYNRLGYLVKAKSDWEEAKRLSNEKSTQDANNNEECHKLNEILDKFRVKHLYHMTHISNLKNILDNGLLSHKKAHSLGLTQTDISDNEVNSRRYKIHDFVPFYFTPKTPMLFKRKGLQDKLVILCVDRKILKDDVMFSDGNAASNSTKFYSNLDDLKRINWKVIRSTYWNDFEDGKRIRSSEVLKRDSIDVSSILKIVCFDQKSLDYVNCINSNSNISTELNRKYYF